jgi:PAS domain-containing protein
MPIEIPDRELEEHGSAEAERRVRPAPGTPREYLHHIPALILLNRLPTPAMALGLDGEIVYANPAFAVMLGHTDPSAVVELPLSALMAGRAGTSAPRCVEVLQAAAGTVIDWCHADGYRLHAVVSKTLFSRATDPVVLITLTDVTDLLWSTSA